jgi:hypothetical protein
LEAEKGQLSRSHFIQAKALFMEPVLQRQKAPRNELLVGKPQGEIDRQDKRRDEGELKKIGGTHPTLRIESGKEKD